MRDGKRLESRSGRHLWQWRHVCQFVSFPVCHLHSGLWWKLMKHLTKPWNYSANSQSLPVQTVEGHWQRLLRQGNNQHITFLIMSKNNTVAINAPAMQKLLDNASVTVERRLIQEHLAPYQLTLYSWSSQPVSSSQVHLHSQFATTLPSTFSGTRGQI